MCTVDVLFCAARPRVLTRTGGKWSSVLDELRMAPRTIAGMFQAHKKLKVGGLEHCAAGTERDGSDYLVRRLTDEELAEDFTYKRPQPPPHSTFLSESSKTVSQQPFMTKVVRVCHEKLDKDETPLEAAEETKLVVTSVAEEKLQASEAVPEMKLEPFAAQEVVPVVGEDDAPVQVTENQKIRMELNKCMACAKRNLRLCEEVVRACEDAFPDFNNLLVDPNWLGVLEGEFQKPYMQRLQTFVKQEAGGKTSIYPPAAKVFNAFNTCPFDRVKVVLLGQDPYHGPGQAMGLSFSVPEGIKVPSSLVNIYKELRNDVGCQMPAHGNLEKWAYQGVLLLNTVLTVREHQANSHAKKGWETFTDAAIRAISNRKTGVVFLLWGNSAQEKLRLINANNHHVLKAAHPSGLSAHRGFFDCRHFSKANELLESSGVLPIDWQL